MKTFLKHSYLFIFLSVFVNSELFAQSSIGPFSPSAISNSNGLSNLTRAYSNDNSRVTFDLSTDFVRYSTFNIPSLTSNTPITGIQVNFNGYSDDTRELVASISWNNGTTFTSTKTTSFTNSRSSDEDISLGGSSDLWGRSSWLLSELTNANFVLRLQGGAGASNVFLDHVTVTIFYTPLQFRSNVTTGTWNNNGTWQVSGDGTTWTNATSAPAVNDGSVTILSGHTVTVSQNISSDQVTIASGGQVSVGTGVTWTIENGVNDDLNVDGSLSNDGAIVQNSSNAKFNSGSTYIHNVDDQDIPTASWHSNSLCSVIGVTTNGDNLNGTGQEFGNFTYNCPNQTSNDTDLDEGFSCAGTFTITNTGDRILRAVWNTAPSIGNYFQNGGIFSLASNTARTMNVSQSFMVGDGELRLSRGNNTGTLNIAGNFTQNGGTITETSSGTGIIIFNGNSPQIFSYTGGVVSEIVNYSVSNGAILEMDGASTNVYGNGFTLSSGGTLNIKSAEGITNVSPAADSSKGNIRTRSRSYSTSANYIYSGTTQSLGNGLTGAKNITLIGSSEKTFSNTSNLDITGRLFIGQGSSAIIGDGLIFTAIALTLESTAVVDNAYYGGEKAPFEAPDFKYYKISTFSYPAVKSSFFNTKSTGILKLGSPQAATLPVTLTSFTAKPTTDNKVSLGWVTSTEQVNKGFRIERQAGYDNGKYEQIGFVGSKAKDGNSQNTLYYSFIDAAPKAGTASFYRLVQEDLDGKKTYSEVRVVKLSAQSVSNVFPNPSTGAINISRTNDGKKMNIQVLDQSGRVISQVNNITDANYRMNLPQSGIYSIKMMYPETGEQYTQRIVVQKLEAGVFYPQPQLIES